MAKRKSTAGPTAETGNGKPELIEQPHGGALYAGGVKGNRGGGDRSSREFRSLMRGDALVARQRLIERLEDTEPCVECGRKMDDKDVMRWFDLTAKYGIGPARAALDPAVVEEMAASVRNRTEASDEVMQAVFQDWGLIFGREAGG